MIIFNNIKYATCDNELIDSLFKAGGTLQPLEKIKKRKNDVLFFIDNNKGFGFNRFGVAFQFTRINGDLFYQITTGADSDSFANEYNKRKESNWSEFLKY